MKPESNEIARLNVDGQVVFYRPGEVIAIGVAAARFVHVQGGLLEIDDVLIRRVLKARERQEVAGNITDALDGDDTDGAAAAFAEELAGEVGDDGTSVSSLPPAFRFTDVDDPEAAVALASARGLRVQLNHVFFSHCGCGCDPCCGGNPYGAFPYKATPYKATPYKATPYKATAPTETSAKDVEPPALAFPEAEESAQALEQGGPRGAEADALPNVNVWILDTGTAHADHDTPLSRLNKLVEGEPDDRPDQIPEEGDLKIDPVAGHGTFIAGIITELAPRSRVWISHLIRPTGDLDEWEVATEIHRLLGSPPQGNNNLSRTLLNLSFGGGLYSACNPLVGEAIAAAQESGVVVIASAGNDASCRPVYPANFPGVTAVGALDAEGVPANFTNRGTWVNTCALGVDIVSTFFEFSNFGGWAIWSGTSFAAPVVVAAIAEEMSSDDQTAAVEARNTVLSRGTPVPCLGVRVEPEHWKRLLEDGRAGGNGDSS